MKTTVINNERKKNPHWEHFWQQADINPMLVSFNRLISLLPGARQHSQIVPLSICDENTSQRWEQNRKSKTASLICNINCLNMKSWSREICFNEATLLGHAMIAFGFDSNRRILSQVEGGKLLHLSVLEMDYGLARREGLKKKILFLCEMSHGLLEEERRNVPGWRLPSHCAEWG